MTGRRVRCSLPGAEVCGTVIDSEIRGSAWRLGVVTDVGTLEVWDATKTQVILPDTVTDEWLPRGAMEAWSAPAGSSVEECARDLMSAIAIARDGWQLVDGQEARNRAFGLLSGLAEKWGGK